jgi:hypothetical protein
MHSTACVRLRGRIRSFSQLAAWHCAHGGGVFFALHSVCSVLWAGRSCAHGSGAALHQGASSSASGAALRPWLWRGSGAALHGAALMAPARLRHGAAWGCVGLRSRRRRTAERTGARRNAPAERTVCTSDCCMPERCLLSRAVPSTATSAGATARSTCAVQPDPTGTPQNGCHPHATAAPLPDQCPSRPYSHQPPVSADTPASPSGMV